MVGSCLKNTCMKKLRDAPFRCLYGGSKLFRQNVVTTPGCSALRIWLSKRLLTVRSEEPQKSQSGVDKSKISRPGMQFHNTTNRSWWIVSYFNLKMRSARLIESHRPKSVDGSYLPTISIH